MEKYEIILEDKSPKKHSVRYNAKDKDSDLSSLYLGNGAVIALGNPDKIKVTIEKV